MDSVDPTVLGFIAFACIYGAALGGIVLGRVRQETFSRPEVRDVLKSARDVIVGVSALTLGLLVATAKTSFDEKNAQLRTVASRAAMLDRTLYAFGPEANDARKLVRVFVQTAIEKIDRAEAQGVGAEFGRQGTLLEDLYSKILQIDAADATKSALKNDAIGIAREINLSRWMIQESVGSSIQTPLYFLLLFWLVCIFLDLGVLAPCRPTSFVALALAALAMTGAIYLALEFDRPYQGLIKVSASPLKLALVQLMPL